MKTTTQPKKRGRPVGSKKEDKNILTNISERKLQKLENEMNEHAASVIRLSPSVEHLKKKKIQKELIEIQKDGFDIRNAAFKNYKGEWEDIEVPTLRRIREPKMSLVNKVTWVLTAVNVAIIIILVIRNV